MLFLFDLELGIIVPYWFLSLTFVIDYGILSKVFHSQMLWYPEFEIVCIRKLTFYLKIFDQEFIAKGCECVDYFKHIITFCSNFIGGWEKKVKYQCDHLNLLWEDAKQAGKIPTLSTITN